MKTIVIGALFICSIAQAFSQDYRKGYMGKRVLMRAEIGQSSLFMNRGVHAEYLLLKAFTISIGHVRGSGEFGPLYDRDDYKYSMPEGLEELAVFSNILGYCDKLENLNPALVQTSQTELGVRVYNPFNQIGSPYGPYLSFGLSMGNLDHQGEYYDQLLDDQYSVDAPCPGKMSEYSIYDVQTRTFRLGFGFNYLLSNSIVIGADLSAQFFNVNLGSTLEFQRTTRAITRRIDQDFIYARLQLGIMLF